MQHADDIKGSFIAIATGVTEIIQSKRWRSCIERGFEYLVISDHSKTAFYAKGLTAERIREQHHTIDELNAKLAPFKIFKSIESDILNDGSLDYSDEILSTFDLVIASVHSQSEDDGRKSHGAID